MNSPYYFYMKVGMSNAFLHLGEKIGGLWVGYAGEPIPEINSNGLCEHSQAKADLKYMSVATSDHWRDQVRIVTYAKDVLMIWKPTESIRYLNRNEGGIDWADSKTWEPLGREWKHEVQEKFGGVGTESFNEVNFGSAGLKFIPAELEQVISRDRLVAPVDSLAVWQHFVRNTFQPIFALTGSESLSQISWLISAPQLPAMRVNESQELKEGFFGRFFRYYFESVLNPSETNLLLATSDQEKIDTALSILNPAQMETAAMLICQDLGLTVDVGLGKGLDVVDVKATARHMDKEKKKTVIKSMLTSLEDAGVNFTPRLKDMIISSSTLRIQCKASNQNDVDGTVLLLEPSGIGKKSEDRLTIEQIITSNLDLPTFKDWITLLNASKRRPFSGRGFARPRPQNLLQTSLAKPFFASKPSTACRRNYFLNF